MHTRDHAQKEIRQNIFLGIPILVSSSLKAPSFAFRISRYILRLGQAAQKQQRPRCPNRKMYLEIRGADEGLFSDGHCLILLDLTKS